MSSFTASSRLPASTFSPPRTKNSGGFIYQTLITIACALGTSSMVMSAEYAASRASGPVSAVIWATVGASLALGLLIAPSEFVAACRRRSPAAALAALALTVVCSLFVLSGALGNAAGGRQAVENTMLADADSASRVRASYSKLSNELSMLPPSRLPGEIEADMRPLNAIIGANNCGQWVENRAVRDACARRDRLASELARAQRRADLEAQISAASAKLDATPAPQRPANADAAAVSRYLAALGIAVTPERITDILTLIAALSIEFGGALALTLAKTLPDHHRISAEPALGSDPQTPVRAPEPAHALVEQTTEIAQNPVVVRLAANGGRLVGSQRDMAQRLGVPQSSLNRVLHALADQGLITVSTEPRKSTIVSLTAKAA